MNNKTAQNKDLKALEAYRFRLKRQIIRLKMLYVNGDLSKREFGNLLIQHFTRINSKTMLYNIENNLHKQIK